MNYIIYLFCLSAFFTSTDCNDFTIGVFEMDLGNGVVYKITRDGKKQIEEDTNRGLKIEYDIEWQSECSYKLYNFHPISGKELLPKRPYDTLYCQITDIDGNSFRVIAKASNFPEKKTPVIRKVR